MKDGAAARQAGIGARQQIDPDTLLESMIGPQPFDDHHPRCNPSKPGGMDDDAAAPVADAHPVAIARAPARPAISGWTRASARPSRAMLDGVLLKLVLRNERDGAATGGKAARRPLVEGLWPDRTFEEGIGIEYLSADPGLERRRHLVRWLCPRGAR